MDAVREDRLVEHLSGDGDFRIAWQDYFREPEHPPDPKHPDGMHADLSAGKPVTCALRLPYPAKRCGCWFIECKLCGLTAALTTAGRRDDPRTVKLGCKTGVQ